MSLDHGDHPPVLPVRGPVQGVSPSVRVKDGTLGFRVGVETREPDRGYEVHVHVVVGPRSRRNPWETRAGRYGPV